MLMHTKIGGLSPLVAGAGEKMGHGTWTETHWSLARSQASSCLLLPADAGVGPLTTGSGV